MKKNLLYIGSILLIVLLLVILVIVRLNNREESKIYHAVITIKDYGEIKLELNGDIAPITVDNFVKLVNEKYYDGLTFHRIMEGFMMQGGINKEKKAENITGEFKENGYNNTISHRRGVISMARATDYNSANSQFFIVHKDSTFLDGQYAAFGKVIEGIDVVDKVIADSNPIDDNGTIEEDKQPIIEKIRMVD